MSLATATEIRPEIMYIAMAVKPKPTHTPPVNSRLEALKAGALIEMPDLEPDDVDIIAKCALTYETNIGINAAEKKLLDHTAFLYKKAISSPCGTKERIRYIRRLLNYDTKLRSGFTSSRYKNAVNYSKLNTPQLCLAISRTEDLYKGTHEVIPSGLPKEISSIMAGIKIKDNETALDLVKRQATSILFIADMNDQVKLIAKETKGTEEELTRTILVNPLGDFLGFPLPAWSMAEVITHEAAHLEWYDMNGNNTSKMSIEHSERYAHLHSYYFLTGLLKLGILNKGDKEAVVNEIKIVKENLSFYNKALGYKADDLIIKK